MPPDSSGSARTTLIEPPLPEPNATQPGRPGARTTVGRRGFVAIAAAETVLALVLDTHRLGAKNLWLDESVTANIAHRSMGGVLSVIRGAEINMGGYFVLAHLWSLLNGPGAVALRWLSVLAAVASVPAIVALGSRLLGRRAGLVAGLVLATSPFFVKYSQDARAYTMLVLFGVLATLALLRAIEQPSRLRWALYAVLMVAAIAVHLFALQLVPIHLLAVALARRDRRAWRQAVWVVAVSAVPAAMAGLILLTQHRGQLARVEWIPATSLTTVRALFPSLTAGWAQPRVRLDRLEALLIVVGAANALAGAVRSRRRFIQPRAAAVVLLLAWATVPVVVTAALSVIKPVFVDRYLIIVLPALVLLVAAGVDALCSIRRRGFGAAAGISAIALLAALAAPNVTRWYDAPSRDPWGYVYGALARAGHGGDVALLARTAYTAGLYYRTALHVDPGLRIVQALSRDGAPIAPSAIRAVRRPGARIWVEVVRGGPATQVTGGRSEAQASAAADARARQILGDPKAEIVETDGWSTINQGQVWLVLLAPAGQASGSASGSANGSAGGSSDASSSSSS